MSVFIDTGVFYSDHDEGATRHEAADAAMDEVYRGELGQPVTSDYVYDEATTLTLRRSGEFEVARTIGNRIRGADGFPDVISMVWITSDVFEAAIDVFQRYDDQQLSFTDATTVAVVDDQDIDAVLSFDDDFDGIVGRVDPAELAN